jgi:hypothetical protein
MGVDLSMDITQDRVIDKFNALLGEFKRDIALGFCLPVELDPVSGTCVNYKRAEEARIVVNTTIIDGRSVHLGVSSRYNLGCGKCTATVQIDTPIFLPGHSTPSIFVYLNGSTIASLVCQSDPANVFADSLLKDIKKLIAKLKKAKWKIIAVEQSENSINYKKIKTSSKTLFIFGAEVEGIEKEILNMCDQIAEIPMKGRKESLNVSVAAGVILYQHLVY